MTSTSKLVKWKNEVHRRALWRCGFAISSAFVAGVLLIFFTDFMEYLDECERPRIWISESSFNQCNYVLNIENVCDESLSDISVELQLLGSSSLMTDPQLQMMSSRHDSSKPKILIDAPNLSVTVQNLAANDLVQVGFSTNQFLSSVLMKGLEGPLYVDSSNTTGCATSVQ